MAKNKSKIFVSGSVVFDTIFSLENPISEQVRVDNGTIGRQNLMFSAKERQVYFGGTGGNITYGLSLLKETPTLFSIAGKDFLEYQKHLDRCKINSKVVLDSNLHTATFYGMTDPNKEQIGIFQGGAYTKNILKTSLLKHISETEIKNLEVAILSAGTAKGILTQAKTLRKINKNVKIILDPGQMLAVDFTKEILTACLKLSNLLILNENEYLILQNKFGIEKKDLWAFGIKELIVTLGEKGSEYFNFEGRHTIVSCKKVKKVLDPTGAGDAFRAGFILGIIKNMSIKDSLILGNKMGAECVKHLGSQTYKI